MKGTNGKSPRVNAERIVELVLGREGIGPEACEVSLTYASAEEIRALNRKYRGKDEATDVLSFPMYGDIEEIRGAVSGPGAPALLGDVVICEEAAKRQAEEYGHSEGRELAYLFTHGLLHLLGYGHEEEEEKRSMRAAEEEALAGLGIVE